MFLSVLVCNSTVAMTLYFHEECSYVGVKGGGDWIHWVEVGVKGGGDWVHLGRGGDGGGSSNARVLHMFGVGPTVQLQ